PYAEIRGWGLSSAPSPPTDWPASPRGPILAMKRAMGAAGIAPAQVDYVSASANGGLKLDRLETAALSDVFSGEGDNPSIASIKGAVGESFSSGGIRTAAMALSLKHSVIPPTLGLQRPLQPLNFVMGARTAARIRYGMVNGFSCGGTFVSLILRSFDDLGGEG
ncbi:MAG: hypothetical protein JJV98_07470, partial [Desulfosarcina sp.]|nr:hypothetical protein [Desulfobacterales bacterium]